MILAIAPAREKWTLRKGTSLMAAVAFLLVAANAFAYSDPWDVALAEESLLVTGNVVAVTDVGLLEGTHTITLRKFGYDEVPWLFPHSRALVVVGEVLRAPRGLAVAHGDTLAIYFATSDNGYVGPGLRPQVQISEIPLPGLKTGYGGVFCAQLFGDELRCMNRFVGADLPKLRDLLAPAQVPSPANGFTAVTLNLWHDQQDWPARRAVIVDTLRALAPDVIFLQEVLEKEGLPNQAQQLADSLGCAFVFTSVDPVGGAKRYGNAILTRLPIVAQHEIKLPPLDDWRVAAHARVAFPDGRALDAYVTRLHHTEEGATIRAEQIAGLIAFVDSTRADGPDAALLIGGDFNAEPEWLELAPMFERFTDVLAAVHPELVLPAAATFGPATGTTPRRIDYLFCDDAQLVPTAARVVLGAPSPAGVWGSDHCGVWARFGAAAGTGR
jgi:endonuclease/exonuclease/phosphatase family metal-dependent hydrolase